MQRLADFELVVSARRKELFTQIDALSAELVRRYRTSTASVDTLLDESRLEVATRKRPDIGTFIRQQREIAQQSIRDLAKRAGVSNPYLSQIERGLRKPSAEILQQIARGLEISAETLYERAGMLDPKEAQAHLVVDAIATDPRLNDEQKQAMLAIYRSFVADDTAQ